MVERGGLENRCARERTVGSNPTPSANFKSQLSVCDINCSMGSNFPRNFQGLRPIRPFVVFP